MAEGPDFPLNGTPARMSVPDALFKAKQSTKCFVKQHTMMTFTETAEEDEGDRRFECSVCLGEYKDSGDGVPRSLLCGHTFCTGCLSDLLKDSTITCPKCKHITPISCHGVPSSLVRNYGVLEIMYTAQSSSSSLKAKQLSIGSSFNSDSHTALSMVFDIPLCNVHGDRMTSFCVKDRVLVCSSCLLYGAHKNHPCQLVMDAGAECRQNMKRLIPDLRTRTDQMKSTVIDIKKIVSDVQTSSNGLSDEIDVYFNQLIEVLEERKRELKMEVLLNSQERVQALVEQSRSLAEAIQLSEDCLDCIHSLLSCDNHTLLRDYGSTRDKVIQLFIDSVPIDPIACDNLYLKFPPDDILDEFKAQFNQHGSVQADLGIVEDLMCDSFHDGFRIHWKNKNFVDSSTYRVQVATPTTNNDYTVIYQGGNTKFTYRRDDLQDNVGYRFRVRVQTIECVGGWCAPIECFRAQPSWLWDKRRRNIKIEVTNDCLQVSSRHSSGSHWASVSGNKVFHHGVFYTEIEILDLAKHHIHKKWFTKIALGVLQSSDAVANEAVEWQDGSNPIGRLVINRSSSTHHSWAYIATSGVKISSTNPDLKEEVYGGDAVSLAIGDRIGMLVNVNEQEKSSVSFFINNTDLGVAYSNLTPPLIPVLSVCDKFSVRLRFPPPPYINRNPSLTLFTPDQPHS